MYLPKLNFIFKLNMAFCIWFSIADCNSNLNLQNSENKSITYLEETKKTEDDVKIPKGNEIELKVEIAGSRKVRITIYNKSSDNTFLPYLSGGKDKYVWYAIFRIERKNKLTGEFEPYGEGHLGTGLQPLGAGDLYRDIIVLVKKGTYRFGISYLIDEKLVEQLNNLGKLDMEQKIIEEKKLDVKAAPATKTIFSEPVEL